MKRNRIIYSCLLLGCLIASFAYGDPFMFMTLYSLIALPIVSLLVALITLFGMNVVQTSEGAKVIKNEPNRYFITITSRSRLGFGILRCIFSIGEKEGFAVDTIASKLRLNVYPFMPPVRFPMDFTIKYRGTYHLGLNKLEIMDFLGLFRLTRKLPTTFKVTAYPRVVNIDHMPFALHMLSKAQANTTMAQEDLNDYTDVRPYGPSDPIKKVHWKLSAKRGEWIVKNYQASALNSMAILLDSCKLDLDTEKLLKLEDALMEHTVAVINYCLRQQMPVDFIFGRSIREDGRYIDDFEKLYDLAAGLDFLEDDFTVNDGLSRHLIEVSNNANVVILTSNLDMPLYDQILNAMRFGHFIAVIYLGEDNNPAFERLQNSGINCVRVEV